MPASRLRFEYPLLKLGRRVTDQQLWCLGIDVRMPGFPLQQLGWRYHSRPDKTKGCGRLSGVLPNEGHVSLWGFGFVACDVPHGALWLDRKGFRPQCAEGYDPNRAVCESNQLPPFHPPQAEEEVDRALVLLGQLADRMAEHEEDVRAILGEDYRRQCLSQWTMARKALDVHELPQAWREISAAAKKMRNGLIHAGGDA